MMRLEHPADEMELARLGQSGAVPGALGLALALVDGAASLRLIVAQLGEAEINIQRG